MSETGGNMLRQLLLLNYEELKVQLTRRLGSSEQAREALQETWLRLAGIDRIGTVHRPRPYLLRIAYNIALKRRRSNRETVTLDDARSALDLIDDAPDPERTAQARSELKALDEALAELPARQYDILLASRVEGMTLSSIADRLGISQRMVEIELKQALMHCGRRLGRKIVQRFGPRPLAGSDYKKTDAP
jgi:RNA polymerase sigma-70 factor (ECF subfamily)